MEKDNIRKLLRELSREMSRANVTPEQREERIRIAREAGETISESGADYVLLVEPDKNSCLFLGCGTPIHTMQMFTNAIHEFASKDEEHRLLAVGALDFLLRELNGYDIVDQARRAFGVRRVSRQQTKDASGSKEGTTSLEARHFMEELIKTAKF